MVVKTAMGSLFQIIRDSSGLECDIFADNGKRYVGQRQIETVRGSVCVN